MPRTSRIVIPGVPLHITQRGVDRCRTFNGDLDFAYYRWALRESMLDSGCTLHAYALMPNHVHLLVTPSDKHAASRLMRSTGCRYVRRFNDLHHRTGTLWEGRFHSSIVSNVAYLFNCSRYIELNPVRAGIVVEPGEYIWSSYRHNACGVHDPLICHHLSYLGLGHNPASRSAAYRAMLATGLTDEMIAAIRVAQHGRSRLRPSASELVAEAILHASGRRRRPGARSAPASRTSAMDSTGPD